MVSTQRYIMDGRTTLQPTFVFSRLDAPKLGFGSMVDTETCRRVVWQP